MKFINTNIHMRKPAHDEQIIRALLNLEHIVSVFSYASGEQCSVVTSTGDRLIVDVPFTQFQDILLTHS